MRNYRHSMKYLLSSWLILKAKYFDYTVNFQKQCAYTAALYSIQPYSTESLIGAKVFPSTSLIFVISSRTLKRAGKTAQTVRRRGSAPFRPIPFRPIPFRPNLFRPIPSPNPNPLGELGLGEMGLGEMGGHLFFSYIASLCQTFT